MAVKRAWWKEVNVYQIYPASFKDSNGDGVGDIPGITSKLDYLKSLGIDVIWTSPIYKTPNKDGGYDISDYRDVDTRFGTLDDVDELIKGLSERGMKLMMDLVVNHTSDQHAWFIESRSSRTNPKRSWYIWQPPKYSPDGTRKPPNNWRAMWGSGSAWQWDETTEEYYLHIFLPEQPDLNWKNIEVREAVHDLMKFWLDKGVGGFRMDVINFISKVDGFPDAPVVDKLQEYQPGSQFFSNGPHVHEYLQEIHEQVLSKYDTITVGEAPLTHDPATLIKYVRPSELNMIFTFEHMDVDGSPVAPLIPIAWPLTLFKSIISKYQTYMHAHSGWNSVYIENHDHARSVTRFGNDGDEFRAISAKMLVVLQISQGGTVYVYQGQEIGMKNVPKDWDIGKYEDVATQEYWSSVLKARSKISKDPDMSDVLAGIQRKARDNARTPIQWSAEAQAGFTTSPTPWMSINDDYTTWNAASQTQDPGSVWSFWKDGLVIRKKYDVLVYGDFRLVSPQDEQVFAFERVMDDRSASAFIVLNFTAEAVTFTIPDGEIPHFEKLGPIFGNYSTENRDSHLSRTISLRPYEGRLYAS